MLHYGRGGEKLSTSDRRFKWREDIDSMEYGRHISNIIDQLEIDHSNDDEGEDR